MKYFIASDHAGFETKELLKASFENLIDTGPKEFIMGDDYPDYVFLLVKNMKKDLPSSKGILICKNGAGVCIAANKFKGIRAAATFSKNHTSSLISDDNINIICLPSEYLKPDEVKQIIQTFQTEEFKPENRHLRRLGKVSIIENSNL